MSVRRASITGVAAFSLFASAWLTTSSTSGAVTASRATPKTVHVSLAGPGWILAAWNRLRSSTNESENLLRHTPQYLFLLGPDGERDLIGSLPNSLSNLEDWSGDGSRAIFYNYFNGTLSVFDLSTGTTIDSFKAPKDTYSAGFTRPRGLALVVSLLGNSGFYLRRYSLSGTFLLNYPRAFSRVGTYNGSYLSTPNGQELVIGTTRGLALVSNSGAVVNQYSIPGNTNCRPTRWWATGIVLASCTERLSREDATRLVELHLGTGAVGILTNPRPPDLGDFSAWAIPSGVYVSFTPGCGGLLGKLTPTHHVQVVRVPGFDGDISVLGAYNDSLALLTAGGCVGGPSIVWFHPSTNTATSVLGPPTTGGDVRGEVYFPDE